MSAYVFTVIIVAVLIVVLILARLTYNSLHLINSMNKRFMELFARQNQELLEVKLIKSEQDTSDIVRDIVGGVQTTKPSFDPMSTIKKEDFS